MIAPTYRITAIPTDHALQAEAAALAMQLSALFTKAELAANDRLIDDFVQRLMGLIDG